MYAAILLPIAGESSVTVKGPVWVALLGVLIPAAVTIMGWFILRWNEDRQNRQRGIESELTHRELQIKEFYGPLFNLVSQMRSADQVQYGFIELLNEQVRVGVRTKEDKDSKEREVRHWFRDTYFKPFHTEMIQILTSKLYLIEGGEVPESFKDYLKHTIDDRARTDLEEKLGSFPKKWIGWPENFESDVSQGLKTAMGERHKLLSIRRTGFPNSRGSSQNPAP
jgi:hypothetical protein